MHICYYQCSNCTKGFKRIVNGSEFKWLELKRLDSGQSADIESGSVPNYDNFQVRVMLGVIQRFLEFHWPPNAAGQGLCGFNKGRSIVVK